MLTMKRTLKTDPRMSSEEARELIAKAKAEKHGEYVDPFEHTPEFALTMRVWSADQVYQMGMDEEAVTRMYNLTKQQVTDYYEQHPHTRILRHHQ